MFLKEEVGARGCPLAGRSCPIRVWGLSLVLDLLDGFSLLMLLPTLEAFGSLCPFHSWEQRNDGTRFVCSHTVSRGWGCVRARASLAPAHTPWPASSSARGSDRSVVSL